MSTCSLFEGYIDRDGYGIIRGRMAHRVIWERAYGPIAVDVEVDHLCRVRACIALDHLELVTQAENKSRAGLAQTHCKQGHEYTPENTYRRSSGHRDCRTCVRERALRYYHRKRAAA